MKLEMGLYVVATAEVGCGPYRLRVAEWAGVAPADVTADHVARYELACNEKGQKP